MEHAVNTALCILMDCVPVICGNEIMVYMSMENENRVYIDDVRFVMGSEKINVVIVSENKYIWHKKYYLKYNEPKACDSIIGRKIWNEYRRLAVIKTLRERYGFILGDMTVSVTAKSLNKIRLVMVQRSVQDWFEILILTWNVMNNRYDVINEFA